MKHFLSGMAVASVIWGLSLFIFSDAGKHLHKATTAVDSTPQVQEKTSPQDPAASDHALVTKKTQGNDLNSNGFPPPEFADGSPGRFETLPTGEFRIAWKAVPGAQRYRVYLLDKSGDEIKTNSTTGNLLYIKNIPYLGRREDPFVDYTVRIASGTHDGTYFEKGEARDLRVYRDHLKIFNDLMAPEIKKIVTED